MHGRNGPTRAHVHARPELRPHTAAGFYEKRGRMCPRQAAGAMHEGMRAAWEHAHAKRCGTGTGTGTMWPGSPQDCPPSQLRVLPRGCLLCALLALRQGMPCTNAAVIRWRCLRHAASLDARERWPRDARAVERRALRRGVAAGHGPRAADHSLAGAAAATRGCGEGHLRVDIHRVRTGRGRERSMHRKQPAHGAGAWHAPAKHSPSACRVSLVRRSLACTPVTCSSAAPLHARVHAARIGCFAPGRWCRRAARAA